MDVFDADFQLHSVGIGNFSLYYGFVLERIRV
jgi:hypothetical protein